MAVNFSTQNERRLDTAVIGNGFVDIIGTQGPNDVTRLTHAPGRLLGQQPPAVDPGADSVTLTGSDLMAGILARSMAAAGTWTLPAASEVAVLLPPTIQVNDCFDLYVINTGADDITIAADAGATITLVGQMTIEDPAAASDRSEAHFRFVFTSVVIGSETATFFRLS